MTRFWLYFLIILFIPFTVPWFFNDYYFVNLPHWAYYSIITTFAFAVIIAFFINKFWSLSAGEENKEI